MSVRLLSPEGMGCAKLRENERMKKRRMVNMLDIVVLWVDEEKEETKECRKGARQEF
jgi:hypothetical protein